MAKLKPPTEKPLWCVIRVDANGKRHWEGNFRNDREKADKRAAEIQKTTTDRVYVSEYLSI